MDTLKADVGKQPLSNQFLDAIDLSDAEMAEIASACSGHRERTAAITIAISCSGGFGGFGGCFGGGFGGCFGGGFSCFGGGFSCFGIDLSPFGGWGGCFNPGCWSGCGACYGNFGCSSSSPMT